jgi:hypothetical protein
MLIIDRKRKSATGHTRHVTFDEGAPHRQRRERHGMLLAAIDVGIRCFIDERLGTAASRRFRTAAAPTYRTRIINCPPRDVINPTEGRSRGERQELWAGTRARRADCRLHTASFVRRAPRFIPTDTRRRTDTDRQLTLLYRLLLLCCCNGQRTLGGKSAATPASRRAAWSSGRLHTSWRCYDGQQGRRRMFCGRSDVLDEGACITRVRRTRVEDRMDCSIVRAAALAIELLEEVLPEYATVGEIITELSVTIRRDCVRHWRAH